VVEPGSLAAQAAKSLAQQLLSGAGARRTRRRLRQGKDAPELRTALITVVKDAVDDAAGMLFAGDEERESFRRALIDADKVAWPLVNGTSPGDLVAEVRAWVAPLLAPPDEEDRFPTVPVDHPYVEAVSTSIMRRLQHWALRSGGSPVTAMWQAFLAAADVPELFDASKFPPRLTELIDESFFDVLQFKYRVVPFVDGGVHGALLAETVAWARQGEDEAGLAAGVISGAAGTGKSRLAAEICDRLLEAAPHWQVGFADYATLASAPVPDRATLLVCDYPERHPAAVGGFLARVWEHRREGRLTAPVRVLLVSRHESSWWKPVQSRVRNLGRLVDHRIELTSAQFSPDEQTHHAGEAFAAFCDGYRIAPQQRPEFSLGPSSFDRPLLVHIAALLAAWSALPAQGSESSEALGEEDANQLLDDLIEAEVQRLLRLRIDNGTIEGAPAFGSVAAVREALCVTTLTAPKRFDLPDLLTCAEAFGPYGTGNCTGVADILLESYPATDHILWADPSQRRIGPVEPDLIAAHLLDRTPGRSEIVKTLVSSSAVAKQPSYLAQLVNILSLAADDYPAIAADLRTHLAVSLSVLVDSNEGTAGSLAGLLAERLVALVDSVVISASSQDLTAARQLTTAVSLPELAADHHIDEAAAAALPRLPYPHSGLAGLGTALATRAVAYYERQGNLPDLAYACNIQGVWLGDYGPLSEAVAAAERAVDLYTELVETVGDGYLPHLAIAISNFANRLGEVGRRNEALTASERAVALNIMLAHVDRAVFLPDLATSIINFSVRLGEAGRRDTALSAGKSAVDLLRELVEDDRSTYLPHLAMSVNNLANRLSAMGHRDEALVAAEEAMAMREELVNFDRAAFLPDFAMSVNNLANRLAEAGRAEEALQTSERAVSLYEELVEANSAVFTHLLAGSVNNLAARLAEVERWGEALQTAERAVSLYEELADGNQAANLPRLAGAVNNLASWLAEAGRTAESLAAAGRTVELYEELAKGNRDAYLPYLAKSLWTAAHIRRVLDVDLGAAVAFCDRATEYLRELAGAEPNVFAGDLAAVEELRHILVAQHGDAG
jgi:tetratricopeptide (TPR) repeat protein